MQYKFTAFLCFRQFMNVSFKIFAKQNAEVIIYFLNKCFFQLSMQIKIADVVIPPAIVACRQYSALL